MTPFEWLIVGHCVGDMLFGQTWYEAVNKARLKHLAFTHALKWTVIMGFASFAAGWDLNPNYGLLLVAMGLIHAVIDTRTPVVWLFKALEYIPLGRPGTRDTPPFLVVWVDQILHVLQIAILALALTS